MKLHPFHRSPDVEQKLGQLDKQREHLEFGHGVPPSGCDGRNITPFEDIMDTAKVKS